jgi:hypothetical protein
MIRNPAEYDALFQSIYTAAMNGQRLYYAEPAIVYDSALGRDVCTVFKVKQRINRDHADQLFNMEFDKNSAVYKQLGINRADLIMDRLRDYIKSETMSTSNVPLRSRFAFGWPASPFEEWLDETSPLHWATAEWFKREDDPWSDYATMVSVHVPIMGDRKQFLDDYGGSFVLTKMGFY